MLRGRRGSGGSRRVWGAVGKHHLLPGLGFDIHFSSLGSFLSGSLSHAAEGCAELGFSQLDSLLLGEGHIVVDTKKLSGVKNVSQVCTRGR